jgi:hypothetical protein
MAVNVRMMNAPVFALVAPRCASIEPSRARHRRDRARHRWATQPPQRDTSRQVRHQLTDPERATRPVRATSMPSPIGGARAARDQDVPVARPAPLRGARCSRARSTSSALSGVGYPSAKRQKAGGRPYDSVKPWRRSSSVARGLCVQSAKACGEPPSGGPGAGLGVGARLGGPGAGVGASFTCASWDRGVITSFAPQGGASDGGHQTPESNAVRGECRLPSATSFPSSNKQQPCRAPSHESCLRRVQGSSGPGSAGTLRVSCLLTRSAGESPERACLAPRLHRVPLRRDASPTMSSKDVAHSQERHTRSPGLTPPRLGRQRSFPKVVPLCTMACDVPRATRGFGSVPEGRHVT